VLTRNRKANDNPKVYEGDIPPVIIVQRYCANGVKNTGKQKNSRETDDAEVAGDEGNADREREHDASRVAEEKPTVVDIVKHLVESR